MLIYAGIIYRRKPMASLTYAYKKLANSYNFSIFSRIFGIFIFLVNHVIYNRLVRYLHKCLKEPLDLGLELLMRTRQNWRVCSGSVSVGESGRIRMFPTVKMIINCFINRCVSPVSALRTPPLTVSCVPLTTVTTNTVIVPCTLAVTSAPGDAVCLTMTARIVKYRYL